MASTVVFDLDKVLLGGDASTLFLHGRLRQAPRRLLLLLLAAPLLVPGSLIPQLRPLSARLMTRIAVGGRPGVRRRGGRVGLRGGAHPQAGGRRRRGDRLRPGAPAQR
jgi:hypothetical protein